MKTNVLRQNFVHGAFLVIEKRFPTHVSPDSSPEIFDVTRDYKGNMHKLELQKYLLDILDYKLKGNMDN